MASSFAFINPDVLFKIFMWLPLSSIAKLRQVCRSLNAAISVSKQLWVKILERDVLAKHMNLHPLRTRLEQSSASHVESWLRCAIHLQHAHQSGMQPTVTRIKLDLRVTWLKIIRTCWCLVASSSERESRLTIWCLRGASPSISNEYYLPGPVIDGAIEDDGLNVVVALTIGTKEMYVHVLSVYTVSGTTAVGSLAILRNVSYVRMLNGPWIVCAVKNGDDTYPTLVNWKNNRRWKLVPRWYIDHANLPWGLLHSAVCTGTRWLDWIVLVMNRTVEIFRIADGESTSVEILAAVSLPVIVSRTYGEDNSDEMDVEEASFHRSEGSKSREGHPILSFSCRIKIGCYSLFSVLFAGSDFIIREGFLQDTVSIEEFPSSGNKFVVGLASNYEVHLRVEGGYDLLPSLIFVNLDRSYIDNAIVGADHPHAIQEGFPLLHFTTSIDYDDGVGLLVIGTCKGYLCFARFLPVEMISGGSLTDRFPTRTNNDEELSDVPVDIDIPPYYLLVQKSKHDFDLPFHLIEETVKTWPSFAEGSLTSGPWSSDWQRYDRVRHWVIPAGRWPMNDTGGYYYLLPVTAHIRLSRTALGEIIPLAYRLDPEIVVFRIGPRHYMVTIYRDSEENAFVDGALPNLDVGAPLDGELLENISRSDFRDNFTWRNGNTGEADLAGAAERIDYLLEVVARNAYRLEPELARAGSDANWWSLEDLQMMHKKVFFWMM